MGDVNKHTNGAESRRKQSLERFVGTSEDIIVYDRFGKRLTPVTERDVRAEKIAKELDQMLKKNIAKSARERNGRYKR
jgi:hypothetical protein